MFSHFHARRAARTLCLGVSALSIAGCTALGGVGPTGQSVKQAAGQPLDRSRIQVVELTDTLAAQLATVYEYRRFADVYGDTAEQVREIGSGDQLNIEIYEAPPAVLFGSASVGGGANTTIAPTVGASRSLPPAIVDENGFVSVPFAGTLRVTGMTPREAAEAIRRRLVRKAHEPQVTVGIIGNGNSAVSVLGDVKSNSMIALSPRGERLLDVIAQSGGVSGEVNKSLIRLSRDGQVVSMPFEVLLSDPSQNIRLHAGDVVTALSQTQSFVALGATGNNVEVPFEATGITLAQALARISGLRDGQADPKGVFVFRYENPAALGAFGANLPRTAEGLVPVIYRADMSKARTFFLARRFQVRDKDVIYVSKAPLTDIRDFVGVVTQGVFSVVNIGNAVN